jgi:hypothetical protein
MYPALMKKVTCFVAFVVLFVADVIGAPPDTNILYKHGRSTLKTVGIVSIVAGGGLAITGLALANSTGDTGGKGGNSTINYKKDNTGAIVAGVGGGLIVAGVILLVAASSAGHKDKSRVSLIAPGCSEVGIGYRICVR